MSKNPQFRYEDNKKVIRNSHADQDHCQKFITLEGHPVAGLPMPIMFGRRPYPLA